MARDRRLHPFLPLFFLICSALFLPSLLAETPDPPEPAETEGREFRFSYTPGERFRILGVNRQDVFFNGDFSHSAVIVTRVVEEIVRVDNGEATVEATYQVSEENSGLTAAYGLEREYASRFRRGATGSFEEVQGAYMPVLRGFPRFPREQLRPGDSWSREAREVHDFRRGYGIQAPYRFSMPVLYTYHGSESRLGEPVERFSASYTIFHRGPAYPNSRFYPETITGNSEQELYWSDALGRLSYTDEEYTFLFILNTGDRVEYRGRATYEVVRIPSLERRALRESLEGTPGLIVEEREEGVTLVLRDVYFEADSARLTAAARSTLREISRVLREVPENDLLITGHTALAGSAAGREALSLERARRVAEEIVAGGSHREEQILYRGLGGRRPAASNATEAGRRRNRRVEITILE